MISKRIRELREDRGWSQFEVAHRTNGVVQPSQVSRYERGTAKPSFDALVALADVFSVSLDELSGRIATPG